jgi:hypothetical protein
MVATPHVGDLNRGYDRKSARGATRVRSGYVQRAPATGSVFGFVTVLREERPIETG